MRTFRDLRTKLFNFWQIFRISFLPENGDLYDELKWEQVFMTVMSEKKGSWKFRLSGVEEFKSLCNETGVAIAISEDVSCLANPVPAGHLLVSNSLAVHPMEGADGDELGRPGPLTYRRYKRFAAGGAGLIWAEAIAVVPEGRANPRQLWLHEGSKAAFAEIVSQMRQAGAQSMGANHRPVIVAQLTHSGRYSKPEGAAASLIPQRDPYRDSLVPEPRPTVNKDNKVDDLCVIADAYLDNLQLEYVKAAKLAYEAGFDAVDIKSCHGYLVNELLASRNRNGKYGGSFENRTRFVLEVIDKIKAELGDKIGICLRLGFYDAIPYPYGWGVDENDYTRPDLTEPKRFVKLLSEKDVRLINFTIANPYYNPHVGRPFNQAVKGAYDEPEHPLVGVERLINLAAEIQQEFPEIALVGTGYSWLRQLMGNVAAASVKEGKVKIVGGGRMAFAYPDFAKDLLIKGKLDKEKVCVGCSACTQLMRDGQMAGCVVRDNKIYGPVFKHGRMGDRGNLARLASNCLQCQEPTCQLGCPAGIEIPDFIQKFLDGDDKGAYEIIRKSNILPEVCAWLCPVEQQCQGSCLQKFIGDGALPIADIQRYLSEQANKNGWSRLNIPAKSTGKQVAILGAGPAGLSAAAILLEAGHNVTIFDKNNDLGGMVDSVIPSDRQSLSLKNEITAIFDDIPTERLEIKAGVILNRDFNLNHILEQGFDAVFIGIGLPKAIKSSESNLDGFYDALEFLDLAKHSDRVDLKGKTVGVIGGGNTAMDVAVTAAQKGAKDVYILYRRSFAEMPAWSAERGRAVEEGVHFLILTQQLEYLSENGKLNGVKVCPCWLGEPDESGRRKPVANKDSAYTLNMDIIVESIGQQSEENIENILHMIKFSKGQIQVNKNFQTSVERVFAGGDIVRGASTVVAAVADGMKAARAINRMLK
jgi:NADPH-dependent glutamate synthase beta subunit-like oxidoreductase/2,4-dienoyl-CoA reductase-like NADH-dependent reductase (Old Yellow Enzyme family)